MTEQDKDTLTHKLAVLLKQYVEEDDVNEGGHWEVTNERWLRLKRESTALLESMGEDYTPKD